MNLTHINVCIHVAIFWEQSPLHHYRGKFTFPPETYRNGHEYVDWDEARTECFPFEEKSIEYDKVAEYGEKSISKLESVFLPHPQVAEVRKWRGER